MTHQDAQIGITSSSGTSNWLDARYEKISENHMDNLFLAGLYLKINASSPDATQQLLKEKVSIMSARPLEVGESVSVEFEVPGLRGAVKALAVVVKSIPQAIDGAYAAALRFTGIFPSQNQAPRQFVQPAGSRSLALA